MCMQLLCFEHPKWSFVPLLTDVASSIRSIRSRGKGFGRENFRASDVQLKPIFFCDRANFWAFALKINFNFQKEGNKLQVSSKMVRCLRKIYFLWRFNCYVLILFFYLFLFTFYNISYVYILRPTRTVLT